MFENDGVQLTFGVAVEKMKSFCTYRDRCFYEVEQKLAQWNIWGEDAQKVNHILLQEGFLNEERFVKNYVRSKFKYNQWGRIKITQGLKLKRISPKLMAMGLGEIDEESYLEMLRKLLNNKQVKARNDFEKMAKLSLYAQGKGFELSVIQEVLKEMGL